MSTFITRLDQGGSGPRLAIKDAIDLARVPTTAGSPAYANHTPLPGRHAACLRGLEESGLHLVGKTNLSELCRTADGLNAWYGTPVNPLDPTRIPGGSSSGSAVALASGEADIALGTDTGGSIRIPAACCGLLGLKTTHGRIPLAGVFPFAPSLDVVGPLARDVAHLTLGMQLIEPGFSAGAAPRVLGRLRPPAGEAANAAVDRLLAQAGFEVREVALAGWDEALLAPRSIMRSEGWETQGYLLAHAGELSPATRGYLSRGPAPAERLAASYARQQRWRDELAALFREVDVLVLPTLVDLPPTLDSVANFPLTDLTVPFNLAGVPSLAVPLPGERFPLSAQLVAPRGGEETLVALAAVLEGSGLLGGVKES